MHELFNDEKYSVAATKAYDFIKRMLDPAFWEVTPYFGEHYAQDYVGKLMWGGAQDIPDDAVRVDPNYIQPERYYPAGYKGVMRGTFKLPEGEDPKNYAVAVYRISGSSRSIECFCPLFTETLDDGTVTYTWSTGRLVEAWEYYLSAFNSEYPYMMDATGNYVPWSKNPDGTSPIKYYKTEFSTSKVVYWYWAETDVGSDSTYAYEIEFVRKDWRVPVTDEVRQSYLSNPSREGYTRPDYLGISSMENISVFDVLGKNTIKEHYEGWIGRDDLPVTTPNLPEYITSYDTQLKSQSFRIPEPEERHQGFIEYGYSRFVDYKMYLYTFVPGDAEYLNAETSLWSDVIYPLPDNPPPIPKLVDEIIDIVIMLGDSTSKRNITFLSTVNSSDGGSVEIVDGTTTAATNEGYISEKFSHTTYKATIKIPSEPFEYILKAGAVSTPATAMTSRPAETNVYRFIAVGDPQITTEQSAENWRNSMQKAFEHYPDAQFIATLGDNVDAQLDLTLAEQQFSMFLSPPELKTHPLITVMGNHDDNMGFPGHFYAPNESSNGSVGGQGDYWTRYDETLFMVLNTNAKEDRIQEHIDFIEETMDYYVNAYGRPKWSIVMFHHSIFQPTNTAEETQYVKLRNALAPVFSKHRVDLVLMGHVHSYCRTHVLDCTTISDEGYVTEANIVPNSNGSEFTKTSRGQTLYVTLNSASGSKYYPLYGDPWYAVKTEQKMVPHITCVDVDNERIIITTHRTDDMSVVDEFTLRK